MPADRKKPRVLKSILQSAFTMTAVPALLLQACAQGVTVPKGRQPNIVLIVADDLGYGDLGSYGNKALHTPQLDRLVHEGVRFTDFHSSSPVCRPARLALLTGRYAHRFGVPGNETMNLGALSINLAKILQSTGYVTGLIGKWHLGHRKPFNPTRHGFDRFVGFVGGNLDYVSRVGERGQYDWWDGLSRLDEEGYVTRLITSHAVEFIHSNTDRPFFLWVSHPAPHFPYQGPGDPPIRRLGQSADRAERVGDQGIYAVMVEELDKSVGEIVETIRQLDLEKNTVVMFYSDNGAAWRSGGSNTPLRGWKTSVWEGGHRVPAIAWWPERIAAGTVSDAQTISLDLFPTFLELAGAKAPVGYRPDGISLVPHLLSGKRIGKRSFYWEYYQRAPDICGRSAREGPWKLVLWRDSYLFNLRSDPEESVNLAEEHPDRVAAMRADFAKWKLEVSADAEEFGGSPSHCRTM